MDDRELLAALRGNDSSVLREWLARDGERLLRTAFLLCGNEADAQDLVQETFLQALKSLDRFGGRSTVHTWLHGILLNLSRHHHRDRKRLLVNDEVARQNAGIVEQSPLPMEEAATRSAVSRALLQLPEPHREVIVLRFYEDLKLEEIAQRLGISKGTVKSRLHYAIEKMHGLLPPDMNLFGAAGTKKKERA